MRHATEVTEREARVLAGRLGLPHTGFLVERTRLRSAAAPVLKGGVLSLVAGPGCGKTAFIMDLLSSADGSRSYVALEEGDRDPVRFIEYLAASIGSYRPDVSSEISDSSRTDGSGERLAELMEKMMEALSEHGGSRLLLAIDDVHYLESSPSAVLALELLVRGMPPGWTVILASRNRLPLGIDGLGLNGRLVQLDSRRLRLTPSEIGAWVKKNWSIDLMPEHARALWRLTHGWPAALVLLGQRLLSSGREPTQLDVVRVIAQGSDLRTYLEKQVVAGLDELTAEVMLAAGLLPRVTLPRDERLFAQDGGTVRQVLDDLVSKGLLVAKCGRDSYIVHPLVRAFAERELLGRDDVEDMAQRAASHMESVGEHYHAARLYLRSGRLREASRQLRALALSSLCAAASFACEQWSGLVPDDVMSDAEMGPWYLICKARRLQQKGDYPEASRIYERATRMLSASGDREGLFLALLGSVFCLHMQSRWKECLAVLERSHKIADRADEKAEVLLVEGQILISLCRWDKAVENWEKALLVAPEGRRPAISQRVHLGRAKLFYSLGHYVLGRQWAERVIESEVGAGRVTRAMALHGASMLACVSGDYERAERLCAETRRMVEKHGLSFLQVLTLLTEADLSLGGWDYRTAVTKCREAHRLATKAGDAECVYWAEQMLGDICRCNRNAERALERHKNAADMAQTNGLGVFEQTRSKAAQGMDLVILDRETEARGILEETICVSREWGLKGSLVPSLFYLGWIHAKEGREHDAARCFGESMRAAEEHRHVHFFNLEARAAVPIFALCDRFGCGAFLREQVVPLLPERLQEYFRVLTDGEAYPTDFPLGVPTGITPARLTHRRMKDAPRQVGDDVAERIALLTEREQEVLRAIAGGMPNKVIGARLFITEKTVKTHANNIFRKLEVNSRLQAALVFQSHQRSVAAGSAIKNRRR